METNISSQLAKHFREIYFGGNWTSSNVRNQLADVPWEQAVKKYSSFNTIAALVYHIHYYVGAVTKVLEGKQLDASDKLSFGVPTISSERDWEKLLADTWNDGERFAQLIEKIPDERLWMNFSEEKYGTYYRNIHGIIEHTHYHLGQIVILKKMITMSV